MLAARQKAILKSKDSRNNKYVLAIEDPQHMVIIISFLITLPYKLSSF